MAFPYVIAGLLLSTASLHAQTDFEQWKAQQQKEFREYSERQKGKATVADTVRKPQEKVPDVPKTPVLKEPKPVAPPVTEPKPVATPTVEPKPVVAPTTKPKRLPTGDAERMQYIAREYLRIKQAMPAEQFTQKSSPQHPYALGVVKNEVLQLALDNVNLARFIAELPNKVVLDESQTIYAQAAAVTMDALQGLTHSPERPANMSDDFYENACKGASTSNLSMGSTLPNSVWRYMDDSSDRNIDRVGHRRWILSPKMGKTVFGLSGRFSAMYTFDKSQTFAPERGYITWPNGVFPVNEMQDYMAWSISIDPKMDEMDDDSAISIELVRVSDGKTWTIKPDEDRSDGQYCTISHTSYGWYPAIIFRPSYMNETTMYSKNDTFRVTVKGLSKPIHYEVKFFDVNDVK
ncbi:hypothetical protein AGMMS49965_17190 [Bacteroidia bacterium]|nr:hypothetical protein AGMMS49965_17190 [Bacteroidia bacterium]